MRNDGHRRRIETNVAGESGLDTYYNTQWQVLEVHEGGDAANPLKQFVWDVRYVDSPVVRFRDAGTDGTIDDTLYYTTDANMNVTALVDTSGTVLERVVYDPYGNPTFYDGDWDNESATSSYDNVVLYCGYRWDGETGLYHVRHRVYHATLGRWIQRDPIGYADGMGLYEYVTSSPQDWVDPLGLREARCGPGCCPGQDDKANTDKVNNYLRRHFQNAIQAGDANPQVWNAAGWLAHDAHGRFGADTNVEMRLYELLNTGTPGLIFDTMAKCIQICGVCIGTDKIGHMFQQGQVLHAIKQHMMREKGMEKEHAEQYATAFSEWTEGLYTKGSYGREVDDWLQKGRIPSAAYGSAGHYCSGERIAKHKNVYGGRWFYPPNISQHMGKPKGTGYWLERSRADHAANMSGMRMYDWLDANWSTDGIKAFNICDFLGKEHQDIGGPSQNPPTERGPGWQEW